MSHFHSLYKPSLSLLTDLYQLTMAYGYWQSGAHVKDAAFHLHFRKAPFHSGFTIACGLADAVAFIENFRFDESDVEYLSTLTGNDGKPLFEKAFLDYLRDLKFSCDVDAVPEGTPVFPYEPLVRVSGPIIECQLLETALLNIINFQTLIATKAARVCLAAKGEPVLEFGARRAQGFDGALTASRAAFVGGCSATSNVLAGKLFGIPVKGTHAHSWVMTFDDEITSFQTYAAAMPNNCVFLVDTYDTLEGVRHATQVGKWLRENGHEMVGVRLDSGDLAYLSIEARKILDEAGFPAAKIFASNDLDETIIESLKIQGAKISVWGVGTKLVTGGDQAALGGVYKLAAIRSEGGEWIPRVKISEQTIKISNPGLQQVRRFYQESQSGRSNIGDVIFDASTPPDATSETVAFDQLDPTRRWTLSASTLHEDLLVPVFRAGRKVYDAPGLPEIQQRAAAQLEYLVSGVKRFVNPHLYPVGVEAALHKTKLRLIEAARQKP
jgi:nicotinate phosphoribosyltransferase